MAVSSSSPGIRLPLGEAPSGRLGEQFFVSLVRAASMDPGRCLNLHFAS
ncbi:hypothetical protein ACNKHT_00375 [Shigella flexneri]